VQIRVNQRKASEDGYVLFGRSFATALSDTLISNETC